MVTKIPERSWVTVFQELRSKLRREASAIVEIAETELPFGHGMAAGPLALLTFPKDRSPRRAATTIAPCRGQSTMRRRAAFHRFQFKGVYQ